MATGRCAKPKNSGNEIGKVGSWQPVRASAAGYTLIELMTTIAVVAILLTTAVPAFLSTMQNARVAATTEELTAAIALARSEAVKRSAPITVCPSDDGAGCSGSWEQGWIVRVDADDTVLRIWDAPPGDVRIGQLPTANLALRFGSLGALVSADSAFRLQVDGCTGERARVLDISPTGRASVRRVACT